MAKNGLPPRFKLSSLAPTAIAAQKIAKVGRFRGAPAERGYDARWNGISLRFRRMNPFCAWCTQEGKDATLADLVDHIIPVQDRPDLVHDFKNLWSLCTHHHGKKFSLEVYARDNGLLHMLPIWCKNPEQRPPRFR